MAKKIEPDKRKQSSEGMSKKAKTELRKREPISLIYPVFAIVAIASAALILNWLEFLGRTVTFWTFGLCGLFLFLAIPIFVNSAALKHKRILPLAIAACASTALSFVIELNNVVDFGDAIFEGELSESNREVQMEIGAGTYWLVLFGQFHEGERGTQDIAPYTVKLMSGEREIKEVSDRFQIIHKRRKMARRAYGYQEYQNLADRFKIKIPDSQPSSLFLSFIDPKLEKIEVGIYESKATLFWVAIALAAFALIIAAELDALLKAAKYQGFFSFSLGAALGFVFYYGTEALPESKVGTFAFDILVGGILGMVIGAGFFYALSPIFTKLNRKFKLLISR